MGTRCQVQCDGHKVFGGRVTLYHHWDGYPRHMIPVIHKAFKKMKRDGSYHDGRSGYVASTLCWADPIQFDIEYDNGNELHGDIEWLYTIDSTGAPVHCTSEPSDSEWIVTVQSVGWNGKRQTFKTEATGKISELAKQYRKKREPA